MRKNSLTLLRFVGILSTLVLMLATRAQAGVSPANVNASPAARTILEYFYSLPSRSDSRVVSGQFGSYGDGTSYSTALEQVNKVYNLSGQYPAMTGMDCATPAGMNEVVRYLTDMWNAGSLVTLSCHFRNPWTGGSSTDTANPDTPDQWDRRSVRDLITPGRPGYTNWIRMLDDLAVHLQTLENRGVVVMFRPLHELNGTWFWWGGQTPDDFRAFWRHLFDYFTRVKGLDNLLWVYSPNTGAGVMNNYPGNDVVDFVGLDEYMRVGEDPMQINEYGEYDALVASGKPVGLFEFGPLPASGEGWNTTSYNWGNFIRDIRSRYPRLVLFQAWEYVWQIGYDRYRGQSTLMNDSWVVTRSELPRWSDGIIVPPTSTVRPTNTPTRVPGTATVRPTNTPTTVRPTTTAPTVVPPTSVPPTQVPGDVSEPIVSGRVTQGLQALYTFMEGSGSTVRDMSGAGAPLNLTISQPSSVRWLSSGGLQINNLTLITNGGAPVRLIDAAMASNELTVEAWVKPANTTQTGSARIVSMSNSPSGRNLTLGQLGNQYEGRIRTSTSTDGNASPAVLSPANSARTELTHLLVTRDAAGNARFYINGVRQAAATLGGDFSNWNRYLWLNLGNELTGDRQWLGELHLVAVYTRALSATEVAQNFAAGARGTNPPTQPTSIPTTTVPTNTPTRVPTTAVPATATTRPTNTPTVIPPTNTPTQIPPTVVPPTAVPPTSVPPTVVPTDAPTDPILPIESDDARVERTRGWVTLTSENASGGTYAINTRAQDALTLSFTGTGIEIVYVGGVFGSFAIEIDGQTVRTVTTTMSDGELSFNNRAIISDLQDGAHTLRILPQNSIVAIDAFVPAATVAASAMMVEPNADLMAAPLAEAGAQALALPEQPPLEVAESLPAAFPTLDTSAALDESAIAPVTEEALPVEAPIEAVVAPSLLVLAPGTYESDDPAVARTAGWSAIPHASASGGSYLMNSAAEDTLTLSFEAEAISVIYAQQPVAGEFILEIDGQAVQQINSSSAVEAFGIVATVDGLAPGVHTLRVLPLGGAAAIDAFAVGGAVVANPAEILPEQPQVFPTLDVQVLPPPIVEAPAELPVEPTPVPQILPLPAFANMEDGAVNWTTSGAWQTAREEVNPGVGTYWTTTPAENQSGSLMWYANFDLATAQRPVLGFQSWLTASASQAVVEVSVDSVNWLPLTVVAPSAGWTPVEIDLTAYAGQLIGFRFVWIQGTAADNWKIDDVSLADIPLPPEMLVTAPAAPTLAPPVEMPAAPPNSDQPIPEAPVDPAVKDAEADIAAEATEPAQP